MGTKLQGKSAVVTGSGRGIGKEIALLLAEEGAKVVINDPGVGRGGEETELAPADEVVEEIKKQGGTAITNYESVTDYEAAGRIVKSCIDNFGKIDILVNCAGILREKMVYNMSEEEWDSVLNVHLKGTFNLTQHASGLMREQKSGRIINVASDAWRGSVGQSNYGAAKGAIVSFTRCISRELGRYSITSNCICPLAATRMTVNDKVRDGWKMRMEKGIITKDRYHELMNMPGPEYIAPVAVYLATEAAADINGQVIGCGGGRVSIYSEPVDLRAIYRDYNKEGRWTVDELIDMMPKTLLVGYVNPAPPEEK
ncbi:SDR family NAD(P)-dependent oxidoreductase [Chloroflexota bacterium]